MTEKQELFLKKLDLELAEMYMFYSEQTPQRIIADSYMIAFKEEMKSLLEWKYCENDTVIDTLIDSNSILEDLFRDWVNNDLSFQEVLEDSINLSILDRNREIYS